MNQSAVKIKPSNFAHWTADEFIFLVKVYKTCEITFIEVIASTQATIRGHQRLVTCRANNRSTPGNRLIENRHIHLSKGSLRHTGQISQKKCEKAEKLMILCKSM
jgi:hypothetical protein